MQLVAGLDQREDLVAHVLEVAREGIARQARIRLGEGAAHRFGVGELLALHTFGQKSLGFARFA